MIDEYQDSNLVQELLLSCVSGEKAIPGTALWWGYEAEHFTGSVWPARSCLRKNTRSTERTEKLPEELTFIRTSAAGGVLEGVNELFSRLMSRELGGVEYDGLAALHPGAFFAPVPGKEDPFSWKPELLLLSLEEGDRIQKEAELAGRRILSLMETEVVWDKEREDYRPVRFGDMVILLRTMSGWAETFSKVLMEMGIPCHTDSQKGYFDAAEVQNVLSYLQILDNPMQDLPLAGVLRSAMGGFSDEELASIRNVSAELPFYGCCRLYLTEGKDPKIREKLSSFLRSGRASVRKPSIRRCMRFSGRFWTGPDTGNTRRRFREGRRGRRTWTCWWKRPWRTRPPAIGGLYHFVRYIESLKKYEVDYGEANLEGWERIPSGL